MARRQDRVPCKDIGRDAGGHTAECPVHFADGKGGVATVHDDGKGGGIDKVSLSRDTVDHNKLEPTVHKLADALHWPLTSVTCPTGELKAREDFECPVTFAGGIEGAAWFYYVPGQRKVNVRFVRVLSIPDMLRKFAGQLQNQGAPPMRLACKVDGLQAYKVGDVFACDNLDPASPIARVDFTMTTEVGDWIKEAIPRKPAKAGEK